MGKIRPSTMRESSNPLSPLPIPEASTHTEDLMEPKDKDLKASKESDHVGSQTDSGSDNGLPQIEPDFPHNPSDTMSFPQPDPESIYLETQFDPGIMSEKRKMKKRDILDIENQFENLKKPKQKIGNQNQKRKKKKIIIRPISLEARGEDSLSDPQIWNNNQRWHKKAEKAWQLGKDISIRVKNSDEEVVKCLCKMIADQEKTRTQ